MRCIAGNYDSYGAPCIGSSGSLLAWRATASDVVARLFSSSVVGIVASLESGMMSNNYNDVQIPPLIVDICVGKCGVMSRAGLMSYSTR